jgi:hypothetical protein
MAHVEPGDAREEEAADRDRDIVSIKCAYGEHASCWMEGCACRCHQPKRADECTAEPEKGAAT